MKSEEDEETFARRRLAEEQTKSAASSCLVRSVHEDLAELYEERAVAAGGKTASLERLLRRLE